MIPGLRARTGVRGRRLRVAAGVAAGLVVGVVASGPMLAAAGADPPGAPARADRARRVLVFAIPFVAWRDLARADAVHLQRFVRRAAIAGLSTRVHARATPLADGYASIGAGSRAVGSPTTVGDGLMVDEPFGVVTAGDAYTERTGRPPGGAVVDVGIVRDLEANARLDYDARIGALGDALARHGFTRAVIANADGSEPDAARSLDDATPPPSRQRQAVLAMVDHRGRVPEGRVDPGLLVTDPAAPFGVRLSQAVARAAFDAAWRDRSVVLVEASDLVRADRYRPYAGAGVRARQRAWALRRADELFAALLARVEPARDLVIVVGPAHGSARVTLTPLAIRGPGFEPGLARSASTRRSGFVQIADLGPTILRAVGIPVPSAMEGEPVEQGSEGGNWEQRLEMLEREDAAAQFRDARIGEFYALVVAAVATVVAGALACGLDRAAPGRRAVPLVALAALGLVPAAFLARLAPLHEVGAGPFLGLLAVLAMAFGALTWILARRRPLDGLLVALGAIVVLLTVDAGRGNPLVFNSVLGYSPTVAGRFTGFGNPTYAAYASAALIAGVLLAHRVGGTRGRVAAASVLAAAVVVDAAPMWGSDVGGILSMVPAFAVALVVLSGRRVRIRDAVGALVALAGVLAAAAAVDLVRPSKERTHLGRLLERIHDGELSGVWAVIERKLAANLASVTTSILGLVLLVTVLWAVGMRWRDPARLRALRLAVPEWGAARWGIAVLAVLGFAWNDSGMTVPGIMLMVFVTAEVFLTFTLTGGPSGGEVPERAPALVDASPTTVDR